MTTSNRIIDKISQHRVMPIAVGLHPENAEALADALTAGGLPILEITLRNEGALNAVRKLRDRQELCLGAGTILSLDQAKAAIDAGARYLVAPGLDLAIAEWTVKNNIPFFPGAVTGTELTQAYNAGLRIVKFFPSEPLGGMSMMRMLAGPFPGMRFIPTGGVTPEMLPAYLESPLIVAVGQSAMVKTEWLVESQWSKVTETCKSVVQIVAGIR